MDTLVVNSEPQQAQVEVYRTNGPLVAKELKANMDEDDAKAIIDSEEEFAGPIVGKTPAAFKLARKGEYRLVVTHEGYETSEINVTNEIAGGGSAGMAGNVLVGGIIGAGVDASSGAMKDLVPNPVEVVLEPVKRAAPTPESPPESPEETVEPEVAATSD